MGLVLGRKAIPNLARSLATRSQATPATLRHVLLVFETVLGLALNCPNKF